MRHCLLIKLRSNMEDKEKILENYYFDVNNKAAYRGPKKLYLTLSKKYPGVFSLHYITQWLNKQDSYATSKQVRRKVRTPAVHVSSVDEQFDADLMSVGNLSKENDGIRFLLFVIDIFSRFLWVKPLKDKTAKSVLSAMKEVFKERKPIKLRSDKGGEFNNRWFKEYMKDKHVHYFVTQNAPKANYVERVQRTFRVMMYRMMRQKRNHRYIDDLDKLVKNYNSSPHSGLKGLAPKEVNKNNEVNVWADMYLKKSKPRKSKPAFRFKRGDFVRLSFLKHPFRRAYEQQFTSEVFKIKSRFMKQGIPMYRIIDLKRDPISGAFYESELQKVDKSEDSLWYVEKILKKRKRQGKVQYLIKW